ncbi:MAG TPA: GMC family oxidoreductase N-terminal domain-containing protein [Polyangiaceae bacterium]|nr:GMC family oxidoreductase N-terminal domain-containing protein [Polyangiaceae bacterium]
MFDAPSFETLPDERLPSGAVIDGELLDRCLEEAFDYVVVGSGAAGAVAAHVLVESGASVVIVEEGPWVRTREFDGRVYAAFKRMFRDAGAQVIEGRAYVPLLQGRCVGGSTVMNSAIVHRTPEDVLEEWRLRFGLGQTVNARALEPHFDALERELNARVVGDEALGDNNRLFLEEAPPRGIPARRMLRYERGCRGSGQCLTGCPTGAKQAMNVTYVPWALARGARLVCSCRVERILVEAGRACGVLARTVLGAAAPSHRRAQRVVLRARRAVVVAASTVQTPNLLRRSGLRASAVGRHFQCHPGYAIAGLFDRPVEINFGVTQGAEAVHLRRSDRIKLETLGMPPELAAARIPGVGRDLMRRFGAFSHLAIWAVVVRAEAEGEVGRGWGGRDKVRWQPSRIDVERARRGAAMLARLLFQAGAREVWPGLHGLPSSLRSIDDVGLIERVPADPRLFGFIASHLFGAARMGTDPRSSVVGTDFQCHEVAGLYVVDSSVFPTNLGVNPQHSIMAISRLAATQILAGGTRLNVAA